MRLRVKTVLLLINLMSLQVLCFAFESSAKVLRNLRNPPFRVGSSAFSRYTSAFPSRNARNPVSSVHYLPFPRSFRRFSVEIRAKSAGDWLNVKAARKELVALNERIKHLDDLYYDKATPGVTDAEYDELVKRAEAIVAAYPKLAKCFDRSERVGAPINEKFAAVRHLKPMLSLDNAYNEDDLAGFYKRVKRSLNIFDRPDGKEVQDERLQCFAEPKIDGLSVSLRYEKGQLVCAATRGDGKVGEDVTENVRMISNVPTKIESEDLPDVLEVIVQRAKMHASFSRDTNLVLRHFRQIRGEVYVSKDAFAALNAARTDVGDQLWATARNAATGSLRQLDPAVTRARNLRTWQLCCVCVLRGLFWCFPHRKFFCAGFFAYAAVVPDSKSSDNTWFQRVNTQAALLENLAAMGFETAQPMRKCQSLAEMQEYFAELNHHRADLAYDIDGAVYKVCMVLPALVHMVLMWCSHASW